MEGSVFSQEVHGSKLRLTLHYDPAQCVEWAGDGAVYRNTHVSVVSLPRPCAAIRKQCREPFIRCLYTHKYRKLKSHGGEWLK